MITIEQIKELMAKATPKDWLFLTPDKSEEKTYVYNKTKVIAGSVTIPDARFIAALPEIAQLCLDQAAEIERLKLTLRGKTFSE